MNRILKELAEGNLSPQFRTVSKNSDYACAMQTLCDGEETLLATLNARQKKKYKRVADSYANVSHLTAVDQFIYGFRLGVLMMVEIYEGQDNLLCGGEVQ